MGQCLLPCAAAYPPPSPERVAILQQVAIFGALDADALHTILAASVSICRPEGAEFFHEGDAGDAMYVLEAGAVEVLKDSPRGQRRLGRLEAGACFGEMALMDLSPRSATVRALMPCVAIEIPFVALLSLYESNVVQFAILMMNMGREVSRRLRIADQAVVGNS
jgi:CRP-like cAMP-binding protein